MENPENFCGILQTKEGGKHKVKKHIAILILVVCLMAMLSVTAIATEEPVTSGSCGEDSTWSYNRDSKTLTISGSGSIWISSGGFRWRDEVEEVEFNGNITEIGNWAFRSFPNLTNIVIPDSVTVIGREAFWGCTNLTNIVIPDSVTVIEGGAFWGCTNLSHVLIPSSVREFRDDAASYEYGVGDPIFADCPLTSAGPIGSGCDIEFGWTDSIPESAFLGCLNLTDVSIPEGIKSIGQDAFAISGLTEVEIPETVIRINEGAFARCRSLKNISVASGNVIYASQDGALMDKEKTTLLLCPGGKTNYTVPGSVRTIGKNAFYMSANIRDITLPNGLETIEMNAFKGCTGLTELVLPASLNTIGRSAFGDCSGLTSLVIPNGVTGVEFDFWGCTSLTEVSLPGNELYYRISGPGLAAVRIAEGTKCLNGTFSGLTTLTTVYLPASLEEIGENAFANCSNLTTVYFAGSQTKWDTMTIAKGNQELSLATVVCTGTDIPDEPDEPDTPNIPDEPDEPDTPSIPDVPGTLELTGEPGGLGRRLTVQVQAGHWLTIQTRRAGSIAISSIQTPRGTDNTVTLTFSAPTGSIVQIWETAVELEFANGVPTTPILNTVTKEL
ncbi:MAG: leucine-rich repeat domain-containing protein [Lawsonibacter sp.]|nr:leucine-rich repeat domain-containing protein [Lawsonibacter sp.]